MHDVIWKSCSNGYANLPRDVLDTLIQRKVKPRLREMMAPFHDLREADSRAWTKKLVSCGNAMEQNARANSTNTTTYISLLTTKNDQITSTSLQNRLNHPQGKTIMCRTQLDKNARMNIVAY